MYQGEYATTYSSMATTFRLNDIMPLVLLLRVKYTVVKTRDYGGSVHDHPIWLGEKDRSSYSMYLVKSSIASTPRSKRVLL